MFRYNPCMTNTLTEATRPSKSIGKLGLPISIGLLAGAFAVFLLGGIRIDPSSTLWLNHGDIAQHYLGWHFFRGEPWALPLGSNPRYGLDMGSSIVFTDSIPLLAIFFKTIRAFLPAHFQYAGGWMVFCFVAQGLCALLLLRRFTANPLTLFAGSVLFVLSPALVARTSGHFALVAQWTILLSLWLYFSPDSLGRRRWYWRALLVFAAVIHGYLLYFVFAIWLANVLRDRPTDTRQIASAAFDAVVSLTLLVCAMWLAGWFVMPLDASVSGGHYGKYAANLMALVNPPWGSPFLPTHREAATATGMESTHYLGVGVLALCVFATVYIVRGIPLRSILARHKYLVFACLAFSALAFSHNAYWGETLVASFPLPEMLRINLEFVRGSGRLLWFAHYLFILMAIVFTVRLLPPRLSPFVLAIALLLQVVDLAPYYRAYASGLKQAAEAATNAESGTMASPFWNVAASKYSEVDFFPIVHAPQGYERIALWAGDSHIAINAAYFARISGPRALANNPRIEKELTVGGRRANTLYVLQRNSDPSRLVLLSQDGVGEVDGYTLVAPDWFKHESNALEISGLQPFGPKPAN